MFLQNKFQETITTKRKKKKKKKEQDLMTSHDKTPPWCITLNH